MAKTPKRNYVQERWNRHWNYQLEADTTARAIFDAAKGKLTPKEALTCARAVHAIRRAETLAMLTMPDYDSMLNGKAPT